MSVLAGACGLHGILNHKEVALARRIVCDFKSEFKEPCVSAVFDIVINTKHKADCKSAVACKEIGINVALGCKIAQVDIRISHEITGSAVDLGEAALFPVDFEFIILTI